MSEIVPRSDIERLVGAPRHATEHYARVSPKDRTMYILHSQECLNSGIDLRDCNFSIALDNGVFTAWAGVVDIPMPARVASNGILIPVGGAGDGLWRPERRVSNNTPRAFHLYRIVDGFVEYLRSKPANYAPRGRVRTFTREGATNMADELNWPNWTV